MKDFSTPDYSTVTRLTKVGYNTVDGETEADYNDIDRERASADQINEAPQMYKRDGVYYLTYSVGGTTSISIRWRRRSAARHSARLPS
ncbi:MAG: hypothetical protein ACLR06_13790 [Christensenellaceae bacterium]